MTQLIQVHKAETTKAIEEIELQIEQRNKEIKALQEILDAENKYLAFIIEQERKEASLENASFVMNWHEGLQFFDEEDVDMDRNQLESLMKLVASFAYSKDSEMGYTKFKFTVKVAGCEASYRIDLNKEHASLESLICEALFEQCVESVICNRMNKDQCLSYNLLKNDWGSYKIDMKLQAMQIKINEMRAKASK